MFTEHYARRIRNGNDWYVGPPGGFWSSEPHLVLEQTFHYPERSASVARYTIVNDTGQWRQFNVWWRHYGRTEIAKILTEAGFESPTLYGSLWGDPVGSQDEWIGVYTRRLN